MVKSAPATELSEHILVCLSSSPSNEKIIGTAAKMASAFNSKFTALFVQTPNYEKMSREDSARLQKNIAFAEKNGASIATVVGDNVPMQIAEFARLSGVTKIVIGRSGAKRNHFWDKPALTEQLVLIAPDIDVYIIPDAVSEIKLRKKQLHFSVKLIPTWTDLLIILLMLAVTTGVGLLFAHFGFSESNIITVYILGVLIAAVFTKSQSVGVIGSLASVLLFNYFFIEPRYSFHTYETEYAVTFAIMFVASLITGTLANRLKENAKQSARAAFRTKSLFDTNKLLQKAKTEEEVIKATANQVTTLLDRNVVIYPEKDGALGEGMIFGNSPSDTSVFFSEEEIGAARAAFESKKRSGPSADREKILYITIMTSEKAYGVIGILLENKSLDSYEYSVLMSILGECALALENLRNMAEKEKAALMAQNERLRANLLRMISHDLRTPLTSISGNASNLLSHDSQLDDETRRQIFTDIYEDSEWLIDLVENLLSVTRLEDGQMKLHLSEELINDVVDEALSHVSRNASEHTLKVEKSDELLFSEMDAKLISQVLINLVNNAIKYTGAGSTITVRTEKRDGYVAVSVSDNGPGISDDDKDHIFEMFYTGHGLTADGKRSLGLGLPLCRSIVEAHGGEITMTDNAPSGCVFTFTLPAKEVCLYE